MAHALLVDRRVRAWMVSIICCAGCVMPYAIPPLRAETGAVAMSGRDTAFHVGGGAHLASGTQSHAQPVDVGVGAFGDFADGKATSGVYADTALFFEHFDNTRTSLGTRGELRWDAMGHGYGAKLRIDHEMYGTLHSGYSNSDHCSAIAGAAHGTGAIGLYAEAGRVWMTGDDAAWTASVGITLRTPSTIGVVAGIPGCR